MISGSERGMASAQVNYQLRDWLFSRQRYWGEPLPVVHRADGRICRFPRPRCPCCRPSSRISSPRARSSRRWRARRSGSRRSIRNRRAAVRETNTMPQWAGSCWYYLRFCDPQNDKALVDRKTSATGCPSTSTSAAPSTPCCTCSTRASGTRCSTTSASSHEGAVPEAVQSGHDPRLLLPQTRRANIRPGEVVRARGRRFAGDVASATQIEKMSKSRFNVVNPDDVVDEFGANSMRLYEMFMGPLDVAKPWQMSGVSGRAPLSGPRLAHRRGRR